VDVNIYKNVFKFVHYACMYRMYDVLLLCVPVVVDVDDFFPVLCFFSVTSCGGLLLAHYYVML
jgi:hypothetical protein